jgi:pimeloyl-ACP methyl ester carboxylesterase
MRCRSPAIEVPVLIGVGERDVCPNPWAEPAAYSRSGDIALLVVPRMAHMHNFAPTRELLWQRIADWSVMLSRSAETQAVSPAISAAL